MTIMENMTNASEMLEQAVDEIDGMKTAPWDERRMAAIAARARAALAIEYLDAVIAAERVEVGS